MMLDLSGIVNAQGEKLGVDMSIVLDSRYGVDGFTLISPVELSGFAQNIGGTLEFFADVKAKISTGCDRCGKTFERALEFELFEELKKGEDDGENPDFVYFSGTTLEIDEIVYKNLFMNLPMKNLCDEECMGLCTVCGKNLNTGGCGCDRTEIDPRLAILDEIK